MAFVFGGGERGTCARRSFSEERKKKKEKRGGRKLKKGGRTASVS